MQGADGLPLLLGTRAHAQGMGRRPAPGTGATMEGRGEFGHEKLGPMASLAAAALDADYGVKPIWLTPLDTTEPPLNSMAQYLFELGQPAAALVWLETAMAGDTRRGNPLFAVRSSLHLAAILHALERHVAALDVLDGTLKLIETQQTQTTAALFLLPRAVAEHNMAVQQLVMDRAPAAAETCERGIAAVRAYVATMRSQHKSAVSGSAGAELRLICSQIECTWLAAAYLCGTPKRKRVIARLRDSRRSLLALAPLGTSCGRQDSPKAAALEPPRRDRSPAKLLPTHYSKHRQRLAVVDPVVDSSRPRTFRFGQRVGTRSRDLVQDNRTRTAWVS